jgi:hypothetical protein
MAKPLEITFHGPFVFRFGKNCAWAYAPKCDEHYLNILTDKEDVVLPRKKQKKIRTFHLTGPTHGKTVSSDNCPIVTYPWDPEKKRWPYTERHWNYVLSFPAPDYIYGLVPEYVWIYGYPERDKAPDPSKPEKSRYARALRFRYNDSPTPPQFNELDSKHFHANHLGGADPGYSIEIRYGHYASVTKKKEEYYLDAQSCFESMREHLSPCDDWKAFFGEPANSSATMSRLSAPHIDIIGGPNGPHDCGAPVMALFEEGVSLKPAEPKTNISSTKGKSKK